jgi:rRNA small subunit pseudouridine methyltransferase Nep1
MLAAHEAIILMIMLISLLGLNNAGEQAPNAFEDSYMLSLILAESSIEKIPPQLTRHPSVITQARRKNREPSSLILDRSFHHSAMKAAQTRDPSEKFLKRGRPDIVFHVLLQVLGSPLNLEGLLRTYVHTIDDNVIDIDPRTRIPRNYDRFIGRLEQLYVENSVPPGEQSLLRIRKCSLPMLIDELGTSTVVAFSTLGKTVSVKDACSLMTKEHAPAVLIGGFAHSHFSQSTLQLANHIFSIDKDPLDAWVVAARIIYEYECGINLSERRVKN